MGLASELVILAINRRGGQPRFSPDLAYSLAAAELVEQALQGRIDLRDDHVSSDARTHADAQPDEGPPVLLVAASEIYVVVRRWLAGRGPWRIEDYVDELVAGDVISVRMKFPRPYGPTKAIAVRDAGRFAAVERRLFDICEAESAPTIEDLAFVALAHTGKCAAAHLKGRANRMRRVRLGVLLGSVGSYGGTAGKILAACLEEIPGLARKAPTKPGDSRSIDEQIGLTEAGRNAALWGR